MRIEFHQSERASLGVEMELALVDRSTGELVSAASEILDAVGADYADRVHPKAKHELFECTIEIITGICGTPAEARADLSATLDVVRAEADRRDLDLICVGTHPYSSWHKQTVSPDDRYQALIAEMQWAAQRLQIFGVHFHVGVRSAEKSIAIVNALCTYLPLFLALSASSPYWEGHDTGMASCRTKIFEALPTTGPPYQLADWAEFEQFMETLVSAQAISSIREVWWDIRPHPNFGTVEFRMCDGIPTLRETTALAALAQVMVEWFDARLDQGAELPVMREWVIRQNKWRAARHGLDAQIITDAHGTTVPARDWIVELVDQVMPVAERLGTADHLRDVLSILDHGASYQRQRNIVSEGGTTLDVVRSLVHELETDEPGKR